MTASRRAISNFLGLAISEIISKGLAFLGSLYLARELGKAGFGLFSLATAVGMYLWIIVDLGITGYGTREVARTPHRAQELLGLLNSLRFVVAMILFILFSLIVLLALDFESQKKYIIVIGAFYIVGFSLSPDWVLRGLEKMQYLVVGSLVTAVSFLAAIFLTVSGVETTLEACAAYSVSFFIGSIALIFLLALRMKIPFRFVFSTQQWFLHAKESVYFGLTMGFATLSLFAPFAFMAVWATDDALGVFSAPHRLATLVLRAGSMAISALYPVLTTLYLTDKKNFKSTVERFQVGIVIVMMPVCVAASFASEPILIFLYGEPYAEGSFIFSVLFWGVFVQMLRGSTSNALASAGFHRTCMLSTGFGTIITILACVFLIPTHGGAGAAFALLIGEVAVLISISRLYSIYLFKKSIICIRDIKVGFAGLLMTTAMASIHADVYINLAAGIAVYIAALFATGLATAQQFRSYKDRLIAGISK